MKIKIEDPILLLSPAYIARRLKDAVEWRTRFFQPALLDYVHILPTLRCNLNCPYCTNFLGKGRDISTTQEISVDDWIAILKKVNKHVIITGGEPTVYKGLVNLLNGISRHLNVQLYTNLTFAPEMLLEKLRRRIYIYGSCHYSRFSLETIRKHVDTLAKSKWITGGEVHFIKTEENKEYADRFQQVFQDSPWNTRLFTDKRKLCEKVLMKTRRHVKCKQKLILIGPDGKRYPCSTKMFQQIDPIADMRHDPFVNRFYRIECHNWGSCASCDGQAVSETEFLD